MARMGKFDTRSLTEFQKKLEKINEHEVDAFLEGCAKELAARLLRMVIKRTPVGQYGKSYVKDEEGNRVRYKSGKNKGKVKRATVKKGGTLRRGWTDGQKQDAKSFVDSMTVKHEGDKYIIEIVNSVDYAPYVEYGHRTADHKGWVPGRFMMTISEKELRDIAPKVLENRLKKFLGGVLS